MQSARVPDSAATCQDALHGAAVKVFQQNSGEVLLSETPDPARLYFVVAVSLQVCKQRKCPSSFSFLFLSTFCWFLEIDLSDRYSDKNSTAIKETILEALHMFDQQVGSSD